MARIKLICGDSLKVLPKLPDASVDAVVTDPPYGATEPGKSKLNGRTAAGWTVFGHDWDTELPTEWIGLAARVVIQGGAFIIWTDTKRTETVWKACEQAGLRPLQVLFWHKTDPPPNPRKNFVSAVEAAVFARKPGLVRYWGGRGMTHNFYEGPKVPSAHKVHPTQKPVDLMAWCIRLICPPGGVVLDPFAGSGTTGVAALREGRRAILIEKVPEYVRIARQRILEEIRKSAPVLAG